MSFIMVSDEAMDNLKLSSTDKLVMGVITSLTTKSDYCYANNDYFSNKVHVSARTITNSLAKNKVSISLEDLVKELSNLTGISIFEIGIKSETNVKFWERNNIK